MSDQPHHGKDDKRGLIARGAHAVRKVTGTPADAVGWRSLASGFNFIEALWNLFRDRHRAGDAAIVSFEPLRADLRSKARFIGLDEQAFIALVRRRQRETYMTAVSAAALDLVLFVLWSIEMIFGHWTGSRVLAAFEFVPFLVMLGYISLHNCSLNWQLRTRRVASLRQFLHESDSLFPRKP
ncbi:hypothetical protein [Kozakia baliensis]|uniref:hypothetical protein n=1 Tax=Kozakia baliensis TaxID=153496 RepID=UPI000879762F|nr:hypothetical protein [Kozakia baliensis]AOX21544.1 hypothetical protein A0U90_13685 [Kozakia baliensis]